MKIQRLHGAICCWMVVFSFVSLVWLLFSCWCDGPRRPAHPTDAKYLGHSGCQLPDDTLKWLHYVGTSPQHIYTFDDVLFHKLREASCTFDAAASLKDILFVVMCSKDKHQRIGWMLESWLAWLDKANYILVAGEHLLGYNITVVPPLPIDDAVNTEFPNATNYQQANLRQLKALYWIGTTPSIIDKYKWCILVDDDTFVNLPMLIRYLGPIPPSVPLLIGHIWANPVFSWPSGGAGMVLSKPAMTRLSSVLFSSCKSGTYLNDVTLGRCCVAANVTKVHSRSFLPERDVLQDKPSRTNGRLDAGMVVTVHRCRDRAHLQKATCTVADRFGWPHPHCTNTSCGAACNP